jgi:acetyl-CoA carboxylase carboxyl transferase subunit beta
MERAASAAAEARATQAMALDEAAPAGGDPGNSGGGQIAVAIDPADAALACPSCGLDLSWSDEFASLRVCPTCRRHFPLPARERLALLVDPDSFVETNAALVSVDPLIFRDLLPLPERLAEAQERSVGSGGGAGLSEAVVTGTARIGGQEAVLIVFDPAYLGASIGVVAGEKIVLAMELAAGRRLPLIALCAAGGARTRAGLLSLAQLPKMAAAAARLHRLGVPFVSVLAHPTTGGVYAGLANQADIIFAEPGAQIGLGGVSRGRGAESPPAVAPAESLLEQGLIDGIVARDRLRPTLITLLSLFADRGSFQPVVTTAPADAPAPTVARQPVWEEAIFAAHPERPTSLDLLRRVTVDFVELHGDRVAADDPAIVCGLARLGGIPVAAVAQERGRGELVVPRREGRSGPAGYRKAARVMRLAAHLELPILVLIDTPGVDPDPAASGASGVAVAQALGLISLLPVPIVSVVVGEAGGVGAIALSVGDRMLMLEHAVYSVAGQEGGAPWAFDPTPERGERATPALMLTARECLRLGIVDAVVPEPTPAAHADPDATGHALAAALTAALNDLAGIGPRRLLNERARRVRGLGQSTPEGREAARREMRELQEVQRALARSLGDLRDRWDARQRGLPRLHLPSLPALSSLQRPDLVDLASRLVARRASEGGERETEATRTSEPEG